MPFLPTAWGELLSSEGIALKIHHKQIAGHTAQVSSCSHLNRNIKKADGLCKTQSVSKLGSYSFSSGILIFIFIRIINVDKYVKRKMTIDSILILAIR